MFLQCWVPGNDRNNVHLLSCFFNYKVLSKYFLFLNILPKVTQLACIEVRIWPMLFFYYARMLCLKIGCSGRKSKVSLCSIKMLPSVSHFDQSQIYFDTIFIELKCPCSCLFQNDVLLKTCTLKSQALLLK